MVVAANGRLFINILKESQVISSSAENVLKLLKIPLSLSVRSICIHISHGIFDSSPLFDSSRKLSHVLDIVFWG